MMPTALQTIWFWLTGTLFLLYALLDGFDLGIAVWYPFASTEDRGRMLDAIGPFWDGNEVWLLAGGGALFAAFPDAYAAAFSGFYLAVMLVIAGLILRVAAIEFRSFYSHPRWRAAWETAFVTGSLIPPLVFGVAAGNLLMGVPLDQAGNYAGSLTGLFSPYTLVTGLLAVFMFATHGALFCAVRTDGDLHRRATKWARNGWRGLIVLCIALSVWSLGFASHVAVNFMVHPRLFLVPLAGLIVLISIPLLISRDRMNAAFVASFLSITCILAIFGLSLYPFLVPTFGNPGSSITIANGSSSEKTLGIMLIMAAIGIPAVLAYTAFLYRLMWRMEDRESAPRDSV